jgi:Ribbon-helix-helix protein, copG family
MTSKAGKANRVKESRAPAVDESTYARVTISMNPGLLKVIDRYADHNEISRSAVFEKALMKWYEALQEEADKDFYSAEAKDPAVRNWNKVTSKTIRYLWNE